MDTNTYTVLFEKVEELTKKLNRLQKKANKYNVPFSFSFGEPYAVDINRVDDFGEKYTIKYEVVDLAIESEIIRKDGYTIIAHLEHSENGNIVNTFVGETKAEWVHMAPFCEHCNSNHNLKYTFLVSNGDEIKQVGKTCLQEYCGINPQMIGAMNEFCDDLGEYTPEFCDRESIPCVFDALLTLALAIDVVKEQGYIKSDEFNSNKSKICSRIGTYHPSEESYNKAVKLAEGIEAMNVDVAVVNCLNNVQSRVKGFYCKPSDFGYFAFAPVAYERYLKRIEEQKRREAEKDAMGALSEYVGTIGERTDFAVKECKLLTTFDSDFGTTFLYRFIDKADNVLIWFASTTIETEGVSQIKATVKNHTERDGVKQTIVNRVKVVK